MACGHSELGLPQPTAASEQWGSPGDPEQGRQEEAAFGVLKGVPETDSVTVPDLISQSSRQPAQAWKVGT